MKISPNGIRNMNGANRPFASKLPFAMKFLHDSRDVQIIRPPHAMLQVVPGYIQGVIAGYVVKPDENAGSMLFAVEMVPGEDFVK
jgi:hypothetical protein